MPIYEFKCEKCDKLFETIILNLSPETQADIKCPACSSRDVKKAVSVSNVGFSSGSTSLSGMPSTGGCNPGSGFS